MNTQTQDLIIQDYQNGNKLTEIFKKYHTSYKSVKKILDDVGIDHSRSARKVNKPNLKNQRVLTREEEEQICKTYTKEKNIKSCCQLIHCSQDVVRRCLQKYNLYRTHQEAVQTNKQNQRKYKVNDDYFDVENERMAYLLGLLASDGCVRKDTNEIKLSFSSVDRDFLCQLQQEVGGRPIKDYITQDGFAVSSWILTSQHIKNQLAYYNIIPQKTFILQFPQHLNKKYWKDFIRGYFDGDGSVSTAGKSAIRFQICAATPNILQPMIDFFVSCGISRVSILCDKKRQHPLYYFQYSSVATRQIYDILYYDNCLCLPRKQLKYQQLIN